MKRIWVFGLSGILLLNGCSTMMRITSQESENYGKRTWGAVIQDQTIESRARINIAEAAPELADAHVVVVSFDGVVLLAGQVASEELKDVAANAVKNMRKISKIHNELSVSGPTSLVARSNDAWLTVKIKSHMATDKDVDANRVKVVTENGVVYLMGLLTRDEAEAAVDLTRQTYGVQKIVKVFQYVN
ncbi:MAG: BON domain-containing protein [Pseudomonadales bacterium]|jgi:osmotically-inducible protein OsmY|nr:BON domain-containing protein [Pseudomonadales bacterium]MDP7144977.1 BON domain-containing protein [Pseudomonadales bacterium]MDP7357159.1 BON domain-containing protein [Pseudomonadales bacterium]MDP7594778.1 BON domain-containing protein [Pseudomonadales bacterium]HJN50043.1 BON domain-containing protein [Pseudomonadales bacterium]|tara:strand:- start:16 stop:579 length:564 start_codon:yes stop_codon:yes gene_type:complete